MENGKFKMKDYLTCGYSLERRSGETERPWRTLSNHIRSIVRKIPARSHLMKDYLTCGYSLERRSGETERR